MPIFTVNGMNCGHCTKTITEALLALDPNLIVNTDIQNKSVTVTVPTSSFQVDTISSENIKNVITNAGYEVTAVVS